MTKLPGNDAIKSYVMLYEPQIFEHFKLVMNADSMEENVLRRGQEVSLREQREGNVSAQ